MADECSAKSSPWCQYSLENAGTQKCHARRSKTVQSTLARKNSFANGVQKDWRSVLADEALQVEGECSVRVRDGEVYSNSVNEAQTCTRFLCCWRGWWVSFWSSWPSESDSPSTGSFGSGCGVRRRWWPGKKFDL